MHRKLILASTSPYRRELLGRLGLPFRSVAPEVDEDSYKSLDLTPTMLARTLARAKARSVAERFPDAVVIGSDQLVEFQGRVLGKPQTESRAVEQLLDLAGRSHRLITSIAIADALGIEEATDVTTLQLRSLVRDEAVRYVDTDRPIDCAGSYKIESLGIALFDRIESEDYTAIIGLPLIRLCGMLRARGLLVP